jgi:hypothetical protein
VGAACEGLDFTSAEASLPDSLLASGMSGGSGSSDVGAEGGFEGRIEAEGATERLPAGRGGLGLF